MSTIIELPDALAEQIRTAAEGEDFNRYAVARLREAFAENTNIDKEADDDLIAALREGIAQADAGQLRTLDQVEETVRARLAARDRAARTA